MCDTVCACLSLVNTSESSWRLVVCAVSINLPAACCVMNEDQFQDQFCQVSTFVRLKSKVLTFVESLTYVSLRLCCDMHGSWSYPDTGLKHPGVMQTVGILTILGISGHAMLVRKASKRHADSWHVSVFFGLQVGALARIDSHSSPDICRYESFRYHLYRTSLM